MNETITNETLKTIAERFSCREFTGEMPTDSQLDAIATAALCAPSAVNAQPWRVIVVTDKTLIDELESEGMAHLEGASLERIKSRGGRMFYNAPCMFVVAIEPTKYSPIDCRILCENITLAAHSIGLSSVICGMNALAFAGNKSDGFKKRLGFPDGFELGMTVLVGKSNVAGKPHEPDKSKLSFVK